MKQGKDYFTMHFQIIASQNDKGGNEYLEITYSKPCSVHCDVYLLLKHNMFREASIP